MNALKIGPTFDAVLTLNDGKQGTVSDLWTCVGLVDRSQAILKHPAVLSLHQFIGYMDSRVVNPLVLPWHAGGAGDKNNLAPLENHSPSNIAAMSDSDR